MVDLFVNYHGVTRCYRKKNDDGGHLIGAQFKGPKDIDNLVPQNSQINRSGGKWFEMENRVGKCSKRSNHLKGLQ